MAGHPPAKEVGFGLAQTAGWALLFCAKPRTAENRATGPRPDERRTPSPGTRGRGFLLCALFRLRAWPRGRRQGAHRPGPAALLRRHSGTGGGKAAESVVVAVRLTSKWANFIYFASVFFTKNRKYDTKYIKEKRGQAGLPVPAVSKKDWRDTDMKNQQAGARIDPLLYHFRIAYIALALLPFVFCFFMLFRIFTSPLPAGYSSVFGYLGALLSLPAILYLAVNLALYEALCALGCALFRRQLQLSKRALALMCAALAAIGFLLHPQVLGMETWLFLINVQTDASPLTLALWGCLQPQVLLAAATLLAGLLFLHFKGPRQAVARLDVKAAAE